jgi:hypothetical protein
MKTANCILCLVPAVSVLGCGQVSDTTCWDTVSQSSANVSVSPTPGFYSARSVSTAAGTDTVTGQDTIYPLSHWGFTVVATDPGNPYVKFSSDGYRYDNIPVLAGVFSYVHGNYGDGTVCPSDGYSISGRFDSMTTASGHFSSIPDCDCSNGGDFQAQYQPYGPSTGSGNGLCSFCPGDITTCAFGEPNCFLEDISNTLGMVPAGTTTCTDYTSPTVVLYCCPTGQICYMDCFGENTEVPGTCR